MFQCQTEAVIAHFVVDVGRCGAEGARVTICLLVEAQYISYFSGVLIITF